VDLIERLHGTAESVVPVVDDSGDLIGIALATELAWSVTHDPSALVQSVVRPASATLVPTDTLEHAAELMANAHVALLPVVAHGTARLIAVATRRDVLNAYRRSTNG
jgi:CBS domain-containing protein